MKLTISTVNANKDQLHDMTCPNLQTEIMFYENLVF